MTNEPKLTEAQKATLMPSIDAFAEGRSNYGAVYDTVARMIADAEQTARAAAWDEGWDAGCMDSDGDPQNPYRSTP